MSSHTRTHLIMRTTLLLAYVMIVVRAIVSWLGSYITFSYYLYPEDYSQAAENADAGFLSLLVPIAQITMPAYGDSLLPQAGIPQNPDNVLESNASQAGADAEPEPTDPEPTPTSMPMITPERIIIPAIALDAPILPATYDEIIIGSKLYHQWKAPNQFAAGWHGDSAGLGAPGNTVLTGHHNIYQEVFRDLVDLKVGDLILVSGGGQEFSYTVASNDIITEKGQPLEIRLKNAECLGRTEDERLTLITCWPYDNNTHRVVIVAFPTEQGDMATELDDH